MKKSMKNLSSGARSSSRRFGRLREAMRLWDSLVLPCADGARVYYRIRAKDNFMRGISPVSLLSPRLRRGSEITIIEEWFRHKSLQELLKKPRLRSSQTANASFLTLSSGEAAYRRAEIRAHRRNAPPSFDTALTRLLRMRFCGRLRGMKEDRCSRAVSNDRLGPPWPPASDMSIRVVALHEDRHRGLSLRPPPCSAPYSESRNQVFSTILKGGVRETLVVSQNLPSR